MSLPPDPSETFVREVDENLRRDQARDFARSYGKWIVAAVLLLLAAIAGYLYWQHRQEQQAVADSEAMSSALEKVEGGNAKAAASELATLGESDNVMTRATALMAGAAVKLRQGDRSGASAIYRQLIEDDGLPQPIRDLASIRLVQLDYDQLKPDDVIQRLGALAEPGKPFFGSAGELVAMARLAKGDRAGAGQLFAKIAADQTQPPTLRARAVQIAGSLGVDASASMPSALPATPAQ